MAPIISVCLFLSVVFNAFLAIALRNTWLAYREASADRSRLEDRVAMDSSRLLAAGEAVEVARRRSRHEALLELRKMLEGTKLAKSLDFIITAAGIYRTPSDLTEDWWSRSTKGNGSTTSREGEEYGPFTGFTRSNVSRRKPKKDRGGDR